VAVVELHGDERQSRRLAAGASDRKSARVAYTSNRADDPIAFCDDAFLL
jgi:hypothetical protein